MFESNKYLVRRKIVSFLGATFEVYDEKGALVLYAKQKAFKLREELKFFSDKEMKNEVLSLKARNILDLSATYDIRDSQTGKLLGAVKRKGLKSILRDEWIVLDESDKEVGVMLEDSMGLAVIRRFLLNLIPQNYDYMLGSNKVADLKQRFNPFVYKLDVDILSDSVDKRLVLVSSIILALVEGRQD
ncbi:MAG: hypothetical protein UT34_C0001G0521 [candidate division WS6 bacterium GW2011_GWF2_39_15]|uniref:Uncharacterized protein n=1 Tax=candidate division WS6 bacterium GW2011_GWF2_39_15 TaxID=1619100 RepID=A0A0G0Q7Q4_9BACT|nr:MAG: hypothetical protein UT34_C0001G0521 [candidate division WS6 bacterium GW2011_GWF2_39_15]